MKIVYTYHYQRKLIINSRNFKMFPNFKKIEGIPKFNVIHKPFLSK